MNDMTAPQGAVLAEVAPLDPAGTGAGTALGAGDLTSMWVTEGQRLLLVDVERFVDGCECILTEDQVRAEH